MIIQSVTGVIFSQDRSQVLLTLRRDVPVWVLPGGGVEPRETADDAVIREILEETGFHVKATRLVGVYTPVNRLARNTNLYECEIISGSATPSSETKDIRFFPLNGLPPLPPPYLEWICAAAAMQPTLHKQLTSVNYWVFFKNAIFHPLFVGRFILSRLGFPLNTK